MLHVLPTFVGGEGVHLDPEGHTFLAAVLPGGELGADAVHLSQRGGKSQVVAGCWRLGVRGGGFSRTRVFLYLDEYGSSFGRIPEKLHGVEVQRV